SQGAGLGRRRRDLASCARCRRDQRAGIRIGRAPQRAARQGDPCRRLPLRHRPQVRDAQAARAFAGPGHGPEQGRGRGMSRAVYIVDGARTPFLKAKNAPGPFAASDLATAAGSALLMRQPFAPEQLDEVILGCASPSPDEVNIGRVVALRLGCGVKVPGCTVMRNCASGMHSLDSAIANLQCGRSQLVLAGGVDALSHAPLLFSEKMVRWLAGWYAARSTGDRLAMLKSFRLGHLAPVIGIMKGLTDPIVGQLMGQTAENLAWKFGITREDMDAFAVESHRRVCAGQDAGHYADELVPLIDRDGQVYAADDG